MFQYYSFQWLNVSLEIRGRGCALTFSLWRDNIICCVVSYQTLQVSEPGTVVGRWYCPDTFQTHSSGQHMACEVHPAESQRSDGVDPTHCSVTTSSVSYIIIITIQGIFNTFHTSYLPQTYVICLVIILAAVEKLYYI